MEIHTIFSTNGFKKSSFSKIFRVSLEKKWKKEKPIKIWAALKILFPFSYILIRISSLFLFGPWHQMLGDPDTFNQTFSRHFFKNVKLFSRITNLKNVIHDDDGVVLVLRHLVLVHLLQPLDLRPPQTLHLAREVRQRFRLRQRHVQSRLWPQDPGRSENVCKKWKVLKAILKLQSRFKFSHFSALIQA